jgi:hypothetical protein
VNAWKFLDILYKQPANDTHVQTLYHTHIAWIFWLE